MGRYSIYKNEIMNDNRSKKFNFLDDSRKYYVYRISDNKGNSYYGSRISQKDDIYEDLLNYCSSTRDKERKKHILENKDNYKFKVIKTFSNRDEMIIYESFLHFYFNVKDNKNFWNKSNQSPFGVFFRKDIWKDEKFLLKMSKIRKDIWNRKGYKESQSKKLKERHADPIYKEKFRNKMTQVNKDLDKRKKAGDKIKENWKDPKFRKKAMANRPSKKIPYILLKDNKVIKEYNSRDELSKQENISLYVIREIIKNNKIIDIDIMTPKQKKKMQNLHGIKIMKKEDYETNKSN